MFNRVSQARWEAEGRSTWREGATQSARDPREPRAGAAAGELRKLMDDLVEAFVAAAR